MEREILIAKEVATKLRVDVQRVYELVRRGAIPVIVLGDRQYRFSAQAIDEFLRSGGNGKNEEVGK